MPSNTEILGIPARPGNIKRKKVRNLESEQVPSNGYSSGYDRILALTVDDVEVKVTMRTYEKMENNATIAKCKRIIITSVLSDDLQFAPGANESEVSEKEFEKYTQIMAFCQRCVMGLERPYRETMEQLLGNGIRYGHGVAESVFHYVMDEPDDPAQDTTRIKKSRIGASWSERLKFWAKDEKPKSDKFETTIRKSQVRLMPKVIKTKPRESFRFVVDDYMTLVGLIPKFKRDIKWDEIIDRDKFILLTINKQDEDPRGRSMYRPAFNWYNLETQIPAEMLRFILEESVPKAVGTLPEDAQPFVIKKDDDGETIYLEDGVTPELETPYESFQRIIQNFRSGSGAVIPYGAELRPYKTYNSGENNFFPSILSVINKQMENSILLQSLAQSESEHMVRAAATVHSDLLHVLIFWIRWLLAMATMNDLLEVAVRENFGDEYVKYMPFISLGDFVRRDWARDLEVVAKAYFQGFIDDTQRAELMAWLNLPKPGPSRAEVMAQIDPTTGDAVMPNNNRPDKQPGNKDRNDGNGTEKNNDSNNKNNGVSNLNLLGHHTRSVRVTPRNIYQSIRTRINR